MEYVDLKHRIGGEIDLEILQIVIKASHMYDFWSFITSWRKKILNHFLYYNNFMWLFFHGLL